MRRVADVSPSHVGYPAPPRVPAHDPSRGPSVGQFSYIRTLSSKARAKASQVDPCLILPRPCKNSHEPRARTGLAGLFLAGHGRDSHRNILMAVAPAPAQYVTRVLTAPSVYNLGCHLQPGSVLTAALDERAKVIDQLRGGVVAHMCRPGERFMINSPARRDRPGQTRRCRAPAFSKICMYSWNIRRTAGRGKLRCGKAAAADGNVHGGNEWLRSSGLPVDAHHLGLLGRLVQMVALHPVALGGEDHRCLPAGPAENVEDVKPVEGVLHGVVVPGEIGDHDVEPEPIADRALHCGPVLGDPHGGVGQCLPQYGLNDLS